MKYIVKLLVVATVLAWNAPSPAQERVLLWPKGEAPGERADVQDKETHPARPTLDLYLVPKEKANGCAVVVYPGGGYGTLAMGHEGKQIGEFFNSHGVSAFVCRYRHAPQYHHPIPRTDAQRALQYVRANAGNFNVDPNRIGIMGFSAGGHLASTVATHFTPPPADSADPLDGVSNRPDFAILCYPVISIDRSKPYTHGGSSKNLLGKDNEDNAELIAQLSNANRVTKDTPPVFIFQTDEDRPVPAENAVHFYLALRKHKVPAEMHIFRPGGHGVGLAQKHELLKAWPDLLISWMKGLKFIAE